MIKIGILSDTHAYLGDYVFNFFDDCSEIWHAGDIGSKEVYEKLLLFKPLRAVWGNIDGNDLRKSIPEVQNFTLQGLNVLLKHIVGRPGKYDKSVLQLFKNVKYNIVVAGHSHILQVMFDKKNEFLFINPGAAGLYGIHQKITLVKLYIYEGNIKDIDIWEKQRT